MISILVSLLIIIIVCGLLYWIVQLLPIPPQAKQVALVVVLLIALVMVLNMFGVVGKPLNLGR